MALITQSAYNYQFHEREKEAALHKNLTLTIWGWILTAITTLLVIFILFKKNRHKNKELLLRRTIDRLEENFKHAPIPDISIDNTNDQLDTLRKKITQQALTSSGNSSKPTLARTILTSDAFMEARGLIDSKTPIPGESALWENLEKAVLAASIDFRNHLLFLTNGNLPEHEYRTALLIKCHFAPGQIAILLNRSISTIGSTRLSLAKKILGGDADKKLVNTILRLL